MDVLEKLESIKADHRKEEARLVRAGQWLAELPQPDSIGALFWVSLDYRPKTEGEARAIVLDIQRVTGILMERDVRPFNGVVYFSGMWNHEGDRIQFTVNGGALSPACRLEEEEVHIPARTETRWKVVCDDEDGLDWRGLGGE